jgi:hypothetical protein
MTEVYVVMINDRHFDPEAYVFSTEIAAVDWARERARDWLTESVPPEGWLFYADQPDGEDDAVWVTSKRVDDTAEVPR